MNFCEVVINFSPEYFEKLHDMVNLNRYQIFTDDISIKQKGSEIGFSVNWIEEYFGYANDTIYSIEERSITNAINICRTADTRYQDIPITDGIKTDIVSRLIFLEEIKHILEKNTNVMFLFSSTLYQCFAITELAQNMEYSNKYGILDCKESKIIQTNFEQKAAYGYKHVFPPKEISLYDIQQSIKKIIDEKVRAMLTHHNRDVKCGFFLTDNAWHLYLNPIYPIIEKFKNNNTSFVIFTLDDESRRHLEEKGYQVINLTVIFYDLLYKILSMVPNPTKKEIELQITKEHADTIKEIRNKIQKIQNGIESINRAINNIPMPEPFQADKYSINVESITDKKGITNITKPNSKNTEIIIEKKNIDEPLIETKPLKEPKEVDVTHVTIIESVYFWIIKRYLKYSRYKGVELGGKIAKPIFVKIEKRARELQKKKQLQIELEKKRMKEIQRQKEQERKEEIHRIRELKRQKEQEIIEAHEEWQKEKIKTEIEFADTLLQNKESQMELSMDLFAKNLELNEQLLKIEEEITKELRKTPLTFPQKLICDVFASVQNHESDDNVVNALRNCFVNDTNALYMSRVCGIILLVSKILESFRFRSLLMSSGGSPDIDLICSIAKKHSIPSYIMTIHPYEEHNPIYKVILNSDKILVAGQRLKKEFVQLGFDEKQITITGNPKFDQLNYAVRESEKNVTHRNLVIVANSRWNDGDELWISDLIRYCNENGLDVLIKIHPVYKNWKQELNRKKIERISSLCRGLKFNISIDASLQELFPKAAVLITEFSWTGFEASLFDVPLIVTNFFGKEFSKYSLQFDREGIALHVKTKDEMFSAIQKILTDKETQERLKNARKTLNEGFNYLNDGQAAQRIFNLLVGKN